LPLDREFTDSNLAKDDGVLRVIKIHSTTSFRRRVKLLACVVKFFSMLKNPTKYERDISLAKFTTIYC
jgi:hypothetical protein